MKRLSFVFLFCSFLLLPSCGSEITATTATRYDNVYAWKPWNPIEAALFRCIRALSYEQACTIGELPPINLQTPVVDRQAVLDRLMVSHQWMGDNFVAFLDSLTPEAEADLLQLFGAVTAIVIDDDVKPSYFSINTGAIYLDPDKLWLSRAQLETLPYRVDYRQAFASQLSFRSAWAYLDSSDQLLYPKSSSIPRTVTDIQTGFASLLFHELAHANDIFPPAEMAGFAPGNRLLPIADSLYYQLKQPSQQLRIQHPLDSSNPWFGLAQVLFYGYTATPTQAMYSAAEVGGFIDQDNANDEYSYASRYEDLAMLLEELLMLKHFDARRELAYLEPLVDQPAYCDDYQVGWGMLHRVARPGVWQRAEFVATTLLPGIDLTSVSSSYTDGLLLPTGGDWCHGLPSGRRVIGDPDTTRAPVVLSPERSLLDF